MSGSAPDEQSNAHSTKVTAQPSANAELRLGLIAAISAYIWWGFITVFFKWVETVPPLELVAHRVVWSVPFCALILSLRGQWPETLKGLADRHILSALAV
ncbi:MAG: hypothetical protein AAF224_10375 [Pseudomonadota bacterium]